MASTDALPVPQKNVAYRLTFGLFKSDGTLITAATGLDSEVSKDAGTFADCTNEATEIATSSGVYYLDLTSTEMNADTVCVLVKSSSTGAVPVVITLYPQEAGDIKTNTTYWDGSAVATPTTAGVPEVDVTHAAGTAWASGAITAASLAADAGNEIADAILARDLGSGSGAGSSQERTVRSALRFLRNKWTVAGDSPPVLTVTKEDDSTAAWTSNLTTATSSTVVTSSDPN